MKNRDFHSVIFCKVAVVYACLHDERKDSFYISSNVGSVSIYLCD